MQWLRDHSFLAGWIAAGLAGLTVAWWCGRTLVLPLSKRICRQPLHRLKRTLYDQVRRYSIWRTQQPVMRWFESLSLKWVSTTQYQQALSLSQDSMRGIRVFSPMEGRLKQPWLSSKLSDYLIASAIERLASKGCLVKLPEPQIGSSYSHAGYAPAGATTCKITYNADPAEARTRERKAEEDRGCIESHYWRLVPWCPGDRYTFQNIEEVVEPNVKRYRIQIIPNNDAIGCRRCWESDPPADATSL